jgi:NADH-quinone oxidoreductase subunit N
MLTSVREYLQGGGLAILPEMELVLFALGLFLFSGWKDAAGRAWGASLALAGVVFSSYTVWIVHTRIAARGDFAGLGGSVLADSSFVFFAALLLAGTGLAVLLLADEGEPSPGLYALLLLAAAGMLLMVSGVHLAGILVGFEWATGSLFLVAALMQARPGASVSGWISARLLIAAVTATALLASGFLVLYRITGSANLGQIAFVFGIPAEKGASAPYPSLTAAAFGLVLAGIFAKFAALPFQPWNGAQQQGQGRAMRAFVSGTMLIAAFVLLLRLAVVVFAIRGGYRRTAFLGLAVTVVLLGVLPMARRLTWRQFLGCAAVVQAGLLMLASGAQNDAGLAAAAFLALVLIFAISGGFAVASVAPVRAASVVSQAILIATLAGLPLTGGYIARREAWRALHQAGSPWLAWMSALAGLPILYGGIRALLASATGPRSADGLAAGISEQTTLSLPALFVLTVSVFVCLAAGLYSEPFLRFARYAFGI